MVVWSFVMIPICLSVVVLFGLSQTMFRFSVQDLGEAEGGPGRVSTSSFGLSQSVQRVECYRLAWSSMCMILLTVMLTMSMSYGPSVSWWWYPLP